MLASSAWAALTTSHLQVCCMLLADSLRCMPYAVVFLPLKHPINIITFPHVAGRSQNHGRLHGLAKCGGHQHVVWLC